MGSQDWVTARQALQLSLDHFVCCTHGPQPPQALWAAEPTPRMHTPSKTSTHLPCGLVSRHQLVWKPSMMWLRPINLYIVWQKAACGTLIALAWCLFSSFTSFEHLYLRLLTEIHIQTVFTCNPWPCFYYFLIIKLLFSGTGALMKVNVQSYSPCMAV